MKRSRDQTPYYQACLEIGNRYAAFIHRRVLEAQGVRAELIEGFEAQLEYGDTSIGLEIKFDRRLHQTGNLCIETAEKSDPAGRWDFVASGICRNDGSVWYGIGDYREFYVFRKRDLYEVWQRGRLPSYHTPTSRGFLLARTPACTLAQRIFEWPENQPLEAA